MEQQALLNTLTQLLSLPRETQSVEFKLNLDLPADIGAYISALANSAALAGHDRAWLVWGVEDISHAVVGTSFDPFKRVVSSENAKLGNLGKAKGEALIMWLSNKTQPKADFEFHECQHTKGRVVMLEIRPATQAPIAFDHVRYVRVDSHKTKLSEHPSKEQRLWNMLGQITDWTGEVVPQATLDDLDPQAMARARELFVQYLQRNETDSRKHAAIATQAAGWDDATLLNKANVTKQGRITRAALLLLGKSESNHFLAPADIKMTWILRDEQNRKLNAQHFTMPFLLETERLFTKIKNEVTEYMPDGTLFPTPIPWYDTWVVREALHNCIAHQDYALGGKINVVEHPVHLVFSNLGRFIPPSVEWMLDNDSPPEHYRNLWLINGMIRLRMMDQHGSGIRRMFDTQRERYSPLPDYKMETSLSGGPRVELSITRQILDVNYTKILLTRTDLSLKQVVLLDKVQKKQPLLPHQIKELKTYQLIEGRAPNVFISASVAEWTQQKSDYITNRGLDEKYYQGLILRMLEQYGQATRKEIESLILPKLPAVLDANQKINKLRNSLQAMRAQNLIERTGSKISAQWRLKKPD